MKISFDKIKQKISSKIEKTFKITAQKAVPIVKEEVEKAISKGADETFSKAVKTATAIICVATYFMAPNGSSKAAVDVGRTIYIVYNETNNVVNNYYLGGSKK